MRKFWIIIFSTLAIVAFSITMFFVLFPKKYVDMVEKYAKENNLPTYMVLSIINIESRFKEYACSSAGAMGLMQLKLSTAMDMANLLGVTVDEATIFDSNTNIRLGTKYISYLLEMFDGNETNALASYNWGLQNVKDWMRAGNVDDVGTITNIPVGETRGYLKKYAVSRWVYKYIYRM